ncbi:hypothetical protein MBLNU230_g0538t1 [Neophaeotheca triangularis]
MLCKVVKDVQRFPLASNKAPPRLNPSKSAPERQMDAIVQASQSQHGLHTMPKATTFHQGYEGGDTQPMDTQVYRDWQLRESMMQTGAIITPKKLAATETQGSTAQDNNTYTTNATDKTPRTYEEGDTGYIDLAGAFQPGSPAHSTSDLGDLLETQRTQGYTQENSRPTFPETPAFAGQKRKANGEAAESQSQPATTTKTPGFTQMFGAAGNAPAFSATQLFNQTQAPSSPLPDAPRSDPVVTRPSPNMNNQYSVSSPEIAASSPMETLHKRPRSTAGEPRDTYTSMRESQERRAARLRKELEERRQLGFGAGDDNGSEEDSDERRMEQRRMHRVLSDRSMPDLARFGAPARASSRPSSSRKKHATIDLVTPATARKDDRLDFDVSDDGELTEDEGPQHTADDHSYGENETDKGGPDDKVEVEAEDEDVQAGQNDNDEYDELAQTVLKSQGGEVEPVEWDQAEYEHDEVEEDQEEGEQPMQEIDETVASVDDNATEERDVQAHKSNDRMNGTQPSAIADSQPQRPQASAAASSQKPKASSAYSFVPGSQHAGRTSQDQARAASKIPDSSGMPKASSLSQPQTSGAMPSSPPRPQNYDTVPEDSAEASHVRRQALAVFQQRPQSSRDEAGTLQEVPESDLPEGGRDHGASNTQSNQPAPYSTARTHLSAGGPSPGKAAKSSAKNLASQQSKAPSPSPRKAAGVSRFVDIAGDSVPDGSGEASLDLDAMMGDVFTAEDQEVVAALSSPPSTKANKRRKTSKSVRVSKSPAKRTKQAGFLDQIDQGPTGQPTATDTSTEHPANSAREPPPSPSKENERPSDTTEDVEMEDATPDSVRRREAAGARAASQLVHGRSAKAAKPANKAVSGNTDAFKRQQKGSERGKTIKLAKSKVKAPHERVSERNAGEDLPQALHDETAGQAAVDRVPEGGIAHGQAQNTEVTNSLRVFALFKGQYNSFYPATWLASSADMQEYRVRFDDTTITSIASHLVARLELCKGDIVKVDLPGMKKNTYIVQGLGTSQEAAKARPGEMDIYGHSIVKVQAKASSRNSFAADGAVVAVQGEVLDVHLSCVYLTHTMWANYSHRTFTPPAKVQDRSTRFVTPSTGTATPSTETPTSRSRRNGLLSGRIASKAPQSHLREGSVTSSTDQSGGDVFAGMAFAISYGSNEAEKALITGMIQRNGGIILESGFDELFALPSLEASNPASPNKRSPRKDTSPTEPEATGLRLKPEHADLGFVALIADRHSRRAKYVQALALGLPTIAGRWITDSLESVNGPLPWTKYLLPAGESSYLSGAVRSRVLASYDPMGAQLSASIESREVLLQGQGVLIVSPKKGKSTWERRKAYAFLTLALGAGHVKRVGDVEEAKALVDADGEDRWKWVYVDGAVGEAASVLFGSKVGGVRNGKKRKRGKGAEVKMSVGDGRVRVVNDEFVVQSLILGALVD